MVKQVPKTFPLHKQLATGLKKAKKPVKKEYLINKLAKRYK